MYQLTKKNFTTLFLGSVMGQGAMFAALPILALLYNPAEIGRLAVFTSMVLLILPTIGLRFEIAIPLAIGEEDAARLTILSLASCTLVSSLYILALLIWKDAWSSEIVYVLDQHLGLLALCLFGAGIFTTIQYVALRKGNFISISKAHTFRGFLGASTQVALGYAGIGTSGLLIGQTLYMGAGGIAISTSVIENLSKGSHIFSLEKLSGTLRRNLRYPFIATPEGIINSVSANLPPILIVTLSGAESGGLFYFAQKITSMPVALVSANISKIYLNEARSRECAGELPELNRKIFISLLMFGFPVACAGILLAASLASCLARSEWYDAILYTCWLIPAALLQFCIMPISFILQIKSMHIVSLALQICGLHLQVGAVLLCYIYRDINPIAAFAFGSAIHYLLHTVIVLRVCQK